MCLSNLEKNVKAIFGDKDVLTFYKVVYFNQKTKYCHGFKKNNTKYISIYRYFPIYLNKSNISNRKGANISPTEYKNKKINKGIHLYRKLEYVINRHGYGIKNSVYSKKYVLKAICKREDYVAHNETEIVFSKVKYTKLVDQKEFWECNNYRYF